jgi:hypothetical protein
MEFGKTMARSYFHTILTNQAYVETFEWAHVKYQGSHVQFIAPRVFETVQAVMQGHHKRKSSNSSFQWTP